MCSHGGSLWTRRVVPHSELPHLPPFPEGKNPHPSPPPWAGPRAQPCLSEAARVLLKKRTDHVFILETSVASFQGGVREEIRKVQVFSAL